MQFKGSTKSKLIFAVYNILHGALIRKRIENIFYNSRHFFTVFLFLVDKKYNRSHRVQSKPASFCFPCKQKQCDMVSCTFMSLDSTLWYCILYTISISEYIFWSSKFSNSSLSPTKLLYVACYSSIGAHVWAIGLELKPCVFPNPWHPFLL